MELLSKCKVGIGGYHSQCLNFARYGGKGRLFNEKGSCISEKRTSSVKSTFLAFSVPKCGKNASKMHHKPRGKVHPKKTGIFQSGRKSAAVLGRLD